MAPKKTDTDASSPVAKPLSTLEPANFVEAAGGQDVTITIAWGGKDGEQKELKAKAKEFTTGSFGWSAQGNITIPLEIEGEEGKREGKVSVSCNLTVQGSKKAPGKTASKSKTTKQGEQEEQAEESEEEAPKKKRARKNK